MGTIEITAWHYAGFVAVVLVFMGAYLWFTHGGKVPDSSGGPLALRRITQDQYKTIIAARHNACPIALRDKNGCIWMRCDAALFARLSKKNCAIGANKTGNAIDKGSGNNFCARLK